LNQTHSYNFKPNVPNSIPYGKENNDPISARNRSKDRLNGGVIGTKPTDKSLKGLLGIADNQDVVKRNEYPMSTKNLLDESEKINNMNRCQTNNDYT
jgi:hypothetical protein